MKFQELLKLTKFEDVKPFLLNIFNNQHMDLTNLHKLFLYLSHGSYIDSDSQLFVRKLTDDFTEEEYYHVSEINGSLLSDPDIKVDLNNLNVDENSLMTYSVMATERHLIAGMKIYNHEKLFSEISKEEVVAICLFEFSYLGITDFQINSTLTI